MTILKLIEDEMNDLNLGQTEVEEVVEDLEVEEAEEMDHHLEK
jgi:hypothetical protein